MKNKKMILIVLALVLVKTGHWGNLGRLLFLRENANA